MSILSAINKIEKMNPNEVDQYNNLVMQYNGASLVTVATFALSLFKISHLHSHSSSSHLLNTVNLLISITPLGGLSLMYIIDKEFSPEVKIMENIWACVRPFLDPNDEIGGGERMGGLYRKPIHLKNI